MISFVRCAVAALLLVAFTMCDIPSANAAEGIYAKLMGAMANQAKAASSAEKIESAVKEIYGDTGAALLESSKGVYYLTDYTNEMLAQVTFVLFAHSNNVFYVLSSCWGHPHNDSGPSMW